MSRERLCFICLKPSHRSQDCRLQFYSCVICQRKHNIALCDQVCGPNDRRNVYNGVARIEYPPADPGDGDMLGAPAVAEVVPVSDVTPDSHILPISDEAPVPGVSPESDVSPVVSDVVPVSEASASEEVVPVDEATSVAQDLPTPQVLSSRQASSSSELIPSTTTATVSSDSYRRKEVLLQCAMGLVGSTEGENSFTKCILFDGCSQRTYITISLQTQLCLPSIRRDEIFLKTFSMKTGELHDLDVVQLSVTGRNDIKIYVEALLVPFICSSIKFPQLKSITDRYPYLQDLDLAEPPPMNEPVDFLVGLDYYFSIVTGRIRKGRPGQPVGVESIISWMVCGPTEVASSRNEVFCQLISNDENGDDENDNPGIKNQLLKFWGSEYAVNFQDEMVLEEFENTVEFNGTRYVAELPLKDETAFIPDHFNIAFKRLESLHMNLFLRDPVLEIDYYKIFTDYEKEGIIEKVFDHGVPGKTSYLPHRPIVRVDKDTTKVRPVFDGSAHEKGGKSLNDYLHPGPALLQLIFDIVIRSCFKKILITADIRQAYLNIEISDKHKDLLRFLLVDQENP